MKFSCTLNCPTPLRDKTLVVEADSYGEAKQKFFDHNGICDSSHDFHCQEIVESQESQEPSSEDPDLANPPQDMEPVEPVEPVEPKPKRKRGRKVEVSDGDPT